MTAVPFELRLHGTPVAIDAQGKRWALEGLSAALLAYVTLDPAPSREKLAHLMWPDSDDPRRNLRQLLLRLKRAVGGAVLVEGDSAFRLADGVVFVDESNGGRGSINNNNSDAIDAIDGNDGNDRLDGKAFAAPLLGDLRFPDSPDFDAWLELQRRQRRERAAARLQADVAQAERSNRFDDALASAQRLVALDPGAEAHHRLVMRMHYLRGDRAAGLAVYDQIVNRLHAQYGLEPDASTRALARSLHESSNTALVVPPHAAVGGVVPATVLRPPRLIGRDEALGALRAAWHAGRAALVLGEPGMGKSRLLADVAAGARVAGAAGRPGDAGVPYATLARLLRRLRAVHQPVFTPSQAAAVARVVPDLVNGTAAVAAAPGDPRVALQGALEAWFAQAASTGSGHATSTSSGHAASAIAAPAPQPALELVILDDLHFADAASIEAMQALISSDVLAALRFALAARPGELGSAGEALRHALADARTLDEIALPPLSVEQTTALVASLGLPELDAQALGPQLARHSGGNPLYALETLKQGLADGSLRNGTLPRPASVGALIEKRLRLLSEPALALARVAAIAGVDFDIALAEAVTGRHAVDLADAWSQLDAAQVLRDGAFAHDLVWDAVLRTIPTPIAQRLHEHCAVHLAAHGGEPARLGAHWMQAGRAHEGAQAFLEAAERARRTGRCVEEAAFLATAAQAFAAVGDAARRFDVLTRRLVALNSADFGAEADQALEELRTLAGDDHQRLRVMREQMQLLVNRGQHAQAAEYGPKALALARSLADEQEQVRISCLLSGSLSMLGRATESRDLLEPFARWVRACAPVDLLALWLGFWATAMDSLGRLRESVSVHEEYHAIASTHGLPPIDVATNLNNLAVTYNTMGRTAQAVGASERAVRVLREDSQAKGMPLLALLIHARHLSEYAHYDEALALFDEALPKVQGSGASSWVFGARNWLGALWLRLGQHARAASLLAADDDDNVPVRLRVPRLALRAQLMEATLEPGARALVERASALVPGEGTASLTARLLDTRIQPAEDTLRLAPRWIELAQRIERYGHALHGWAALARAASTLGEHARAADAARRAVALLADGICPEPMYHVEAWLIAAGALRAAGHADEADAAIGAGMQWVQRHAVPHVPAAFLDSFLHRNPHNAALLRAGRAAGQDRGGERLALE